MIGLIGTVIGIIIGTILTPVVEKLKYGFLTGKYKEYIKQELLINKEMIPHKQNIISQCLYHLYHDAYIPTESVRFINTGYSEGIIYIYKKSTNNQIICLEYDI